MKKFIIAGIVLLIIAVGIVAIGGAIKKGQNNESQEETVNIVVPDGAPLLNVVSLGDNATTDSNSKIVVNSELANLMGKKTYMQVVADADQLTASIQKDSPDIAIVPVNLAAKLYNEQGKYQAIGVSTWGLNEILSNQNISNLQELKGKQLISFGKAGTPGVSLRTLLQKEGLEYIDTTIDGAINPDKVNIVDVNTGADVVSTLTANNPANPHYILLPEPVASTFKLSNNFGYDVKINLQDSWQSNFDGEKYPQSVVIIKKDFVQNPKNANYIQSVIAAFASSLEEAKSNPEETAKIAINNFQSTVFKSGSVLKEAFDSGRLNSEFSPLYNGNSESTANQKAVIDYLQSLSDFNEQSKKMIGGSVPDAGFFPTL